MLLYLTVRSFTPATGRLGDGKRRPRESAPGTHAAGCYTQLKHAQTDVTAYPADPDADAVADPGGTPLPHPECEIFPNPVSWSHLMDLHVGEAGAWEELRVLVRHAADAREGLRPWQSGGAPPMQKMIIRGSATVELLVCLRGQGVRRVTLDLSGSSDASDPSVVVEPYRIIPLRLVPVRTRQLGMYGEPGELSGPFPEEASVVRLCIQRIDLPQPCLDSTTPRD